MQRARVEATASNRVDLCEAYYRELFDLQWSEYHLWRDGHIADYVMRAWVDGRKRNFESDKITVRPLRKDGAQGKAVEITYKSQWERLLQEEYFMPGHTFVLLMAVAHDGKIEAAMRMKNVAPIPPRA